MCESANRCLKFRWMSKWLLRNSTCGNLGSEKRSVVAQMKWSFRHATVFSGRLRPIGSTYTKKHKDVLFPLWSGFTIHKARVKQTSSLWFIMFAIAISKPSPPSNVFKHFWKHIFLIVSLFGNLQPVSGAATWCSLYMVTFYHPNLI